MHIVFVFIQLEVFRPISRGKVLGREGGGYLAQSESIAGSELRMAHLFFQKYMNYSLILNIQIADTYLFYPHAIYFLTSLKNTSLTPSYKIIDII